jgi:hypothetical protein
MDVTPTDDVVKRLPGDNRELCEAGVPVVVEDRGRVESGSLDVLEPPFLVVAL